MKKITVILIIASLFLYSCVNAPKIKESDLRLEGSLEFLYEPETIALAKAALNNAAAVYGGSPNVVTAGGRVQKFAGGLTTVMQDGTVFVPVTFFYEFLGLQNTDSLNTISQTINGVLYAPAAQAAEALGLYSVIDRKLAVIGKDDSINAFRRPGGRGTNQPAEIAAYLAFYDPPDFNVIDAAAACKQVKDKWRMTVVGNQEINDLDDPHIAQIIKQTNDRGQAAWDRLIKSPFGGELFRGIRTTGSAHMSEAFILLFDMAKAWGTYGTELYHNKKLKRDILYGLEFMYQYRYGYRESINAGWRDPWAFNWWDWQIQSPTQLIPTMLIMEDFLTAAQKKKYTIVFDTYVPISRVRGENGSNGANMVNFALLTTGSALLKNDIKRIITAQTIIDINYLYMDGRYNPITYNDVPLHLVLGNNSRLKAEGFYSDGSYVYHNLHGMNGQYGMEHLIRVTDYLMRVMGTPFSPQTPQVDNIFEFIYNAFDALMFQAGMFSMAIGREYMFYSATGVFPAYLKALDFAEPEDAAKIKSIIKEYVQSQPSVDFYEMAGLYLSKRLSDIMNDDTVKPRGDLITNRVYYEMDKSVHQRGDWAAGISMSSSRIFNYEALADVNLKGWYIGDGRTEYFVKGDLRHGSAAYWRDIDFYRLPGTTVDTQERKALWIGQYNEYLSSKDFVGGVSLDGTWGVSAMWLEAYHNAIDTGIYWGPGLGSLSPAHTNDLTAKKSYFMFDDELVCLGADINAKDNNDAEVLTIVENRWGKASRVVSDSGDASQPYQIAGVVASETPEPENPAEHSIDDSYFTRWAAQRGATITWDLGQSRDLGYILLSFMSGKTRRQSFTLEVSEDGNSWIQVFDGSSSGNVDIHEAFDLNGERGRFVRFTNRGNSGGSEWVSLADAKICPYNPDGSIGGGDAGYVGTDMVTIDGTPAEITNDDFNIGRASWAHLDGAAGYYFPNNGGANPGTLKARWSNGANSYFEMWYSHGVNPTNGTYAYVLLPGKTAEQTREYARNPGMRILSNTADIQAARDDRLGLTGIVFWNAGIFEGITASEPMIVMVQDNAAGYKIAVTDPTQKLTSGTITINRSLRTGFSDDMMTVSGGAGRTVIDINFTGSRGRSMQADFYL